jgi:Kef-type K+ transport system membrane component KefB
MPAIVIWLIQLIVVLGAARLAGWASTRLGQPRVVGEMAAGIMLGPSLMGWLAPGFSQAVLSADKLGGLSALSQLGLLIFMFLIGLELHPAHLRESGPAAAAISLASLLAPFALGAALAAALHPWLADGPVPALHFALFIGTAMSITAFPVLARILSERGMLQTPVGAMAIACAAADDILAWCLLAAVVFLIHSASAGLPIWLMLAGGAAYVAAMLTGVRRIASRLLDSARSTPLTQAQLAVVLLVMAGSAAITEWLGVHALFGAFLAGAIMPRDASFARQVRAKLEDITVVFLLPLFFAATGLRTNVGLLGSGSLWLYAALLLAAAVLGKLGGASVAARAAGMPWRESLAVGALMNTRGLMELVVAGIGLEIGVISPAVYTMLVLIALATTCMTSPLLDLLKIAPRQAATPERDAEIASEAAY